MACIHDEYKLEATDEQLISRTAVNEENETSEKSDENVYEDAFSK